MSRLTVGRLRALIEGRPDEAEVGIILEEERSCHYGYTEREDETYWSDDAGLSPYLMIVLVHEEEV
jgi:hypothetical protein